MARAKKSPVRRFTVALVFALLAASVELHAQATLGQRDHPAVPSGTEPIAPLPREVLLDADEVRLGEKLFHDVRLSRGDAMACASCHRLADGGDDNLPALPASMASLSLSTPPRSSTRR